MSGILTHPVNKTVQAVEVEHQRAEWIPLDDEVRPDFAALAAVDPGDLKVLSRSDDDASWVVAFLHDAGPVGTTATTAPPAPAHYLFSNRSDLDGYVLTPMFPQVIEARGGTELIPTSRCRPGRTRTHRVDRIGHCPWSWTFMAARGRATVGASTPNTSCSPTAATPSCR